MSVGKQMVIGSLVLLTVAAGGFLYYRNMLEGGAEAALRRGPRAVLVEVAEVEAGVVRERIEAVGSTLARQAVDIVSLAAGRVLEIAFTPGQLVETGALLLKLDDAAERADVAEAEAGLREAELALERAQKLRTNNTVAQATVDELEAAHAGARARLDRIQNQLTERTIVAPFTGIVGMRRVDVGARVDNDTVLTTLDDLVEIEIDFSVPEIFYARVRPGQTVTAISAAFPGRAFAGRITTIDTRIGQVSRAFRVHALLPNADLSLPAGMFMHVEVVLEERPALLIPEEAVIAEGAATFVFVVTEERAIRRDLRLGQREAGAVEVLDGLEAGEQVVRSGLQRLRDGASVRLAGADDGGRGAGQGRGGGGPGAGEKGAGQRAGGGGG
jgi:membrane fusion protein (multidrug efflux system)